MKKKPADSKPETEYQLIAVKAPAELFRQLQAAYQVEKAGRKMEIYHFADFIRDRLAASISAEIKQA